MSEEGVESEVRLSSSSDETERSETAWVSVGVREKRNARAGGTGAMVMLLLSSQELQAEAAADVLRYCNGLMKFVVRPAESSKDMVFR